VITTHRSWRGHGGWPQLRQVPSARSDSARGGRLLSKSRVTPQCAAAQFCVPAAPILNFLVEALGGEANGAQNCSAPSRSLGRVRSALKQGPATTRPRDYHLE
jgi:hypothetical protein